MKIECDAQTEKGVREGGKGLTLERGGGVAAPSNLGTHHHRSKAQRKGAIIRHFPGAIRWKETATGGDGVGGMCCLRFQHVP